MSEDTVIINQDAMLPVGTLLQGGKYRIERYLSSGGFGNTYVVTNMYFEETYAMKEFFMKDINLRSGNTVTVSMVDKHRTFEAQRDKFLKEARRLRKLHNEHLVQVHDLFEENGTAYYVMDFIKGETMKARLNRLGRPLSEDEVMPLLHQALDVLQVVHREQIWHLDIKPDNIMVDENGKLYLIDFGASKQLHSVDGQTLDTTTAMALTKGYAPIEQMEQNLRFCGPWTDLYALGATLYKLLTNQTPPSASEMQMFSTPLLFPTPVSAKTQQLIGWMMRPRLDERPQSVDDVRRFFEGKRVDEETVVMDQPEQDSKLKLQPKSLSKQRPTPTPNNPTRQGKSSSSSKLLWWGVCTGVVATAVAAAVGAFMLLKKPSVDPANEYYLEMTIDTTKVDYYIKPLAKNLDEHNSVDFNKNLRLIDQAVEESLLENNPREAVKLVEAVRFFINTHYEDINSFLGFSTETMQETEKLTNGTVQDFIQGKAKMLGVKLPADVFEDKKSKSGIKESKSEMRIW